MALTHAERQKKYRQKKAAEMSMVQQMAETMFEFIKREAHYYQERSRWPSMKTDIRDDLFRKERAKIIETVLFSGKSYRPEFEYDSNLAVSVALEISRREREAKKRAITLQRHEEEAILEQKAHIVDEECCVELACRKEREV